MLTSVSKFLDLAVNSERLSSMLKENKRTVELDSARAEMASNRFNL
jgi:hypothetical protein